MARCQRCRRREAAWCSSTDAATVVLCQGCLADALAALTAETVDEPLRELAELVAGVGGGS